MPGGRSVYGRVDPTSEDLDRAQSELSRWGRTPQPGEVRTLAVGLAAARLADAGDGISDTELRAAHDALSASSVAHCMPGLLESMAEALLGRGMVPQPWEHDGKWWLWWPKKGRGPCQSCGQQRSLTRYSNLFGRPYRGDVSLPVRSAVTRDGRPGPGCDTATRPPGSGTLDAPVPEKSRTCR